MFQIRKCFLKYFDDVMHVTIQNKKIFKNRFENFAFFYTVEGF